MLLPALGFLVGAGLLFSVKFSSGAEVRGRAASLAQFPLAGLCTDLPQWIQAPTHLGSPCLQPPLSFYLLGGGARAMGAPHSPLDPPKRLSHRPLSPVGGGTCATTGDPVPEACSGLFLLVPRPQQVWAVLRVCSVTDLL